MNAKPAVVDFADSASLVHAFEQADCVIFTSPIDYRPGIREHLADQIAKAAKQAQVKRIVFNSAGAIFEGYDRPVAQVLKAVQERLRAAMYL